MSAKVASFAELALAQPILQALSEIGYEAPSPIQAESIPPLLAGRDIIGQAQTGTGKTAAFALPLLSRIDLSSRSPQVLVLTPTRELAIQVAEAFQVYARRLKDFHVLPVYGGQGYDTQLRQLKRGVQVVVGTPGRVMDHLRRKTLKLDHLLSLVLDEADEMLRMGFIEDVEWILEHTPDTRQVALFSATMPEVIRKVAHRHLQEPVEIRIKTATTTVSTIEQQYWQVTGTHKLDALTRILEVEDFDAAIIFVRTKTSTVDLAEKLEARGYACAALNGDITQANRERTVEQLKNKRLDIVVATDVAARGLDVPRISHVINYDIPTDTEAYVHRIGRTGRAGRAGRAILFVAPRETRMLRAIERATRQKLEPMRLPTAQVVSDKRIAQFKAQIKEILASQDLDFYRELIADMEHEQEIGSEQIAAALAYLVQKDRPLRLKDVKDKPRKTPAERRDAPERPAERGRKSRPTDDIDMVTYRLAVGRNQGVEVKDIVGAIANEAGVDSQYIGYIKLDDDSSTVELPPGMPPEVFEHLKTVRVRNHPLQIRLDNAGEVPVAEQPRSKPVKQDKVRSLPRKKKAAKKKARTKKRPSVAARKEKKKVAKKRKVI